MRSDDLIPTCDEITRILTPLREEAEAVEARAGALRTALASVRARYPRRRRSQANADANLLHAALEGLPDGSPGPAHDVDAEVVREALSAIEDLAMAAREDAEREDRQRLADLATEAQEIRGRLGLSPAESNVETLVTRRDRPAGRAT